MLITRPVISPTSLYRKVQSIPSIQALNPAGRSFSGNFHPTDKKQRSNLYLLTG
jgi:hypothetical protein